MKKLIVITIICLTGNLNAQGLLNNLRACYPLDCSAVNNATTGSTYDGIVGSGCSCSTGHTGLSNTAYQFSGNGTTNGIVIQNTSLLNSPTEICISGWFKVTSGGYLIYTAGTCGAGVSAYQLKASAISVGNVFSLQWQGGLCSGGGGPSFNILALNVPASNWFHVVCYNNLTTASLWLNGSLVQTQNHPSGMMLYGANKPIVLGASLDPFNDQPFAGSIDNVRFYDRGLNASEIMDLYTNDPNCNSSGTPPPPVVTPVGNYCANPTPGLTGDYQVPLNGFHYNFTTPANTTGKVIIGRPSCTSGQARLTVADDNIGNSIFGTCSTTGDNIGVKGTGMDLNANASVTTYGVVGEARQPNDNPSALSAGLAGFCGGMNSSSMPPGENIGVYGNSLANNGKWAGYFDGDVQFNGIVWGSQNVWVSDKRFKNNINELGDVSAKLKNIKGYSYLYKTDEFKNRNFPKTEQIGFLAQELKEAFPQLVIEDAHGYLGVNYVGFIPVLLQAHKEQQTQIENQQQQIDELKALVQSLAGTTLGGKNKAATTTVELSDKNAIVLNQNVPNPFAETTVINYNVPSDFGKAQIIFSTADGKVIKVVEITEKGAGSLNVFANDLTHGLYSYTLVVDGKTIDTKKMIKE